jgi:hypothetical protein
MKNILLHSAQHVSHGLSFAQYCLSLKHYIIEEEADKRFQISFTFSYINLRELNQQN